MRVLKILSRSFCALLIGLTIYGILVLYSWGCLGGVPYRQQAIFGAIMLNDTNRVVRLLGENVNPNGRSIKLSQQTPLIYAVRFAPPEMVKLLLERGADPNQVDANGYSPLYYSIVDTAPTDNESDLSNVFRILLDYRANLLGKGVPEAIKSISQNDPRFCLYTKADSNKKKQK